MIDYFKDDHSMEMQCDEVNCNESSQFYGEFLECIAEAKEEGWKIFKLGIDWRYKCPVCAKNLPYTDPREVFDE